MRLPPYSCRICLSFPVWPLAAMLLADRHFQSSLRRIASLSLGGKPVGVKSRSRESHFYPSLWGDKARPLIAHALDRWFCSCHFLVWRSSTGRSSLSCLALALVEAKRGSAKGPHPSRTPSRQFSFPPFALRRHTQLLDSPAPLARLPASPLSLPQVGKAIVLDRRALVFGLIKHS